MTATHPLYTLWPGLLAALRAHPRARLALAAAWLDPLLLADRDALDEYPYSSGSQAGDQAGLLYALDIARRALPELYAATLDQTRRGATPSEVEADFCQALNTRYDFMDLSCYEDLSYGVPCAWAGLEPWDPDFPDQHPALEALLRDAFGLRRGEEDGELDSQALQAARDAAMRLVRSLAAQRRQPCADVGCLLLWLFALSGSSLVDYTAEEYAEMGYEALEWHPTVLDHVAQAHREAALIIQSAGRALDHLRQHPPLSTALRRNAQRALKLLAKGDRRHARYPWPGQPARRHAARGAPGTAGPDDPILFLWDHYRTPDRTGTD
jgi:hypothetical protein